MKDITTREDIELLVNLILFTTKLKKMKSSDFSLTISQKPIGKLTSLKCMIFGRHFFLQI